MVPHALPTIVRSHTQSSPTAVSAPLRSKDSRLDTDLTSLNAANGDFKNFVKWLSPVTRIVLETTEKELYTDDCFFVYGKAKVGNLMEAYSLLYRLRWVKYRNGKPNFELTIAKEAIDRIYSPNNEFEKRQFEYSGAFISEFDKMDPRDKAKVLSGQPMIYTELPQSMQDSFKKALLTGFEGVAVKDPKMVLPSNIDYTKVRVTIKDESKSGTGIREMWLTGAGGFGSGAFRWNDYDKDKTQIGYGRTIAFIHEPLPNTSFSKTEMIAKSEKLKSTITIPQTEGTLSSLLKNISAKYGVNFITNKDSEKRTASFSCENLPLWEAMDRISQEFGGWEWELAPGDFIVMRSSRSPRRRSVSAQ